MNILINHYIINYNINKRSLLAVSIFHIMADQKSKSHKTSDKKIILLNGTNNSKIIKYVPDLPINLPCLIFDDKSDQNTDANKLSMIYKKIYELPNSVCISNIYYDNYNLKAFLCDIQITITIEINKNIYPIGEVFNIKCYHGKNMCPFKEYNIIDTNAIIKIITDLRCIYYQNIKPIISQFGLNRFGYISSKHGLVAEQCANLVNYVTWSYNGQVDYDPIYDYLKSKQEKENKLVGSIIQKVLRVRWYVTISIPGSMNFITIVYHGCYVSIIYEKYIDPKKRWDDYIYLPAFHSPDVDSTDYLRIFEIVETLVKKSDEVNYNFKLPCMKSTKGEVKKHKYLDIKLLSADLEIFINKLNMKSEGRPTSGTKLSKPWKLLYDEHKLPFYEYSIANTNTKICLETIYRPYNPYGMNDYSYYELNLAIYESNVIIYGDKLGTNVLERMRGLDNIFEMPNGIGLMLRVINMFKNIQ